MSFIPKGYVNDQSTCVFTSKNVPKVLLEPHQTKRGVYGQLHVLYVGIFGRHAHLLLRLLSQRPQRHG